MTEKTQENEEEDKSEDSVTQEELFAGKSKGKDTGKGVCQNCGESDHSAEIVQVTSMMVERSAESDPEKH